MVLARSQEGRQKRGTAGTIVAEQMICERTSSRGNIHALIKGNEGQVGEQVMFM